MNTIKLILAIGGAGAAGTLARYGLSLALDSRFKLAGEHPLYGTLAANALGCLLFGLALAWFEGRVVQADHPTRLAVLTGFMGAFTTFSTFAYLSSDLMQKQQWLTAGGHILMHNVVGITLFVAGAALGSKIAA
ncbi:MAG: CrcB family protein [Planctomycetota bacterium]